MLTLTCDYVATGEGRTVMFLFTQLNQSDAIARFKELFPEYYLPGVQLQEGLDFSFPAAKMLFTEEMQDFLKVSMERGMTEYFGSLHFNWT